MESNRMESASSVRLILRPIRDGGPSSASARRDFDLAPLLSGHEGDTLPGWTVTEDASGIHFRQYAPRSQAGAVVTVATRVEP